MTFTAIRVIVLLFIAGAVLSFRLKKSRARHRLVRFSTLDEPSLVSSRGNTTPTHSRKSTNSSSLEAQILSEIFNGTQSGFPFHQRVREIAQAINPSRVQDLFNILTLQYGAKQVGSSNREPFVPGEEQALIKAIMTRLDKPSEERPHVLYGFKDISDPQVWKFLIEKTSAMGQVAFIVYECGEGDYFNQWLSEAALNSGLAPLDAAHAAYGGGKELTNEQVEAYLKWRLPAMIDGHGSTHLSSVQFKLNV